MPDLPDFIPVFLSRFEQAAIVGVETYLKSVLSLPDRQITVEYDELPPNLTGNWHVCIIPNGLSKNSPADTNFDIFDHSVNFDIALIRRVQDAPKDRKRNKFLLNANSLANAMGEVDAAIDRNYSLLAVINTTLTTKLSLETGTQSTYPFIEPPKLQAPGPTRSLGSGVFGGKLNQSDAAIVRRYRYTGLRRIVPRSVFPAEAPF